MIFLLLTGINRLSAEELSPDALAKKVALYQNEQNLYADALERFLQIIQNKHTLSEAALNKIPYEVRNIALYRTGDRQNKAFSKSFYNTLEQAIINRLTQVKRFAIKECFECKVTKVLLRKDQFMVVRQVDSTEGMKKIAKAIGADSFLLWDAYLYKGRPILDLRLFSAETGSVVWSDQYKAVVPQKAEVEWYTSSWSIPATRKKTSTGTADVSSQSLFVIGRKVIDQSTISDKVQFAYGAEAFWNPDKRPEVALYGFGITGTVYKEVDSWFGNTGGQYSNYQLYLSAGQYFNPDSSATLATTGLKIRFSHRFFAELGWVSVVSPTGLISKGQTSKTGLENTATLFGSGAQFSLGARF